MAVQINLVVSYRFQGNFDLDKAADRLLHQRHGGSGSDGKTRDLSYWFKTIKDLNVALRAIRKDKRFKIECCSLEGWQGD